SLIDGRVIGNGPRAIFSGELAGGALALERGFELHSEQIEGIDHAKLRALDADRSYRAIDLLGAHGEGNFGLPGAGVPRQRQTKLTRGAGRAFPLAGVFTGRDRIGSKSGNEGTQECNKYAHIGRLYHSRKRAQATELVLAPEVR